VGAGYPLDTAVALIKIEKNRFAFQANQLQRGFYFRDDRIDQIADYDLTVNHFFFIGYDEACVSADVGNKEDHLFFS
jgi:hypothetical protein